MSETYSCIICGKEFEPYRIDQKYCSVRCRNKSDKDDRRFSGVRDYVIRRDNFKCVKCGSQSNLTVHHKDWIRTNNDPSNLETLCRSCHPKEHFDIVDRTDKRICFICGGDFFPLRTKKKTQILCRRQVCKAKYKAMQKRKLHEEVACKICGNLFMQKHSQHICCSAECTAINNDRSKADRYLSKREELKAKQIRYYNENKEIRKAYIKKWQSENPEKVKAYKLKNLQKHSLASPSLSQSG
jgi:hypothetical protein